MKVALVHDFLVRYWGAEKVLLCLSSMFPEAPIFTLFYDKAKMGAFFGHLRINTSSIQRFYNLSLGRYTHLLWMMPGAIEEFDFWGYDLVISSSAAFSHGIITNPETFHLTYVHSPMRWAWDYFHRFPKERWFGNLKTYFFSNSIHSIRQWDYVSAWRADRIIVASKVIQDRVKKFWNKDSQVVYPFYDDDQFTPIKNPSKDYYLVVSQLVPYKKIDQIVQAFNKFWQRLIIVWTGIEEQKLKKIAKSNIEFKWNLFWNDVLKCFQNAKGFIFAGIDDFGITPVEAMGVWVPVLAFRGWWVTETVIEWETWYFYEEQSSDSLLNLLQNANINQISPKRCSERAKEFSRARFVSEIRLIIANNWLF